jgi:hypothetical protein
MTMQTMERLVAWVVFSVSAVLIWGVLVMM